MPAPELSLHARLPEPGDNAAIAVRRLEAGMRLAHEGREFELSHTVLEGHRFAVRDLARGEELLSWGLPFGRTLGDLPAGTYLCNERARTELGRRSLDLTLPARPNFEDHRARPDLSRVVPGRGPEPVARPGTFLGHRRPGGRGVGTRDHVVVLGLTDAAGPFAQTLAARFAPGDVPGDGVVAVAHTEDGRGPAEHRAMVLRALSGFLVHPNVGAVLVVDAGDESLPADDLLAFARQAGLAVDHVPHAVLALGASLEEDLARGARWIAERLEEARGRRRSEEPLSELRLALQCGGSDAFSGVSGNALAGRVARELIRHGGGANLAETDELIGAEDYVLSNVRDLATAQRFLDAVDRFQERARLHGASAEGNPSGGNILRGLYNITLKSIGAARKKDPAVRLDHVLEYAEPMRAPGFAFMDSPGNDLESIAGQVASGCNLILFITGNGSITNFPFVPTLKFVTTTARFELLRGEMDVNAGRFGDGEPMEDLAAETFEVVRRAASGERTRGELAGHAQVSLWRAWRQTAPGGLERERARPRPSGRPLAARPAQPLELAWAALEGPRGPAAEQVGLVLPTSLCSGQVARLAAERLTARGLPGVTRFVAPVHTEGCGSAGAEETFFATLGGHLRHRATRRALLLEHGCEKTHNDAMRAHLAGEGVDLARLGFASVQLDGGLEAVLGRIERWFADALGEDGEPSERPAGARDLRLGIASRGAVGEAAAEVLAALAAGLVAAGGTAVVAASAGLWDEPAFRALLADDIAPRPTLASAQEITAPGLHVMDTPGASQLEAVSALAASGVDLILFPVAPGTRPPASSPLVPVVGMQCAPAGAPCSDGVDLALGEDPADALAELTAALGDLLSRRRRARLQERGLVGFQLTRGPVGISL